MPSSWTPKTNKVTLRFRVFLPVGEKPSTTFPLSVHGNCPEIGHWDEAPRPEATFNEKDERCCLKGVMYQKEIQVTLRKDGVLQYKYKRGPDWEYTDKPNREHYVDGAVGQYIRLEGRQTMPRIDIIDFLGDPRISSAVPENWAFTPPPTEVASQLEVAEAQEESVTTSSSSQGSLTPRTRETETPTSEVRLQIGTSTAPSHEKRKTVTPPKPRGAQVCRLGLHYSNGAYKTSGAQQAFLGALKPYLTEAFLKKGIQLEILTDNPNNLMGMVICRDNSPRTEIEAFSQAILSGFATHADVLGLVDGASDIESVAQCPYISIPVWFVTVWTAPSAPKENQPGIPHPVMKDIKKAWPYGSVYDHVVRKNRDRAFDLADVPHKDFDKIAEIAVSEHSERNRSQ
ncbi:unnamed protein product [Vitrella brassicaformis CCMP3155]|uniref:CBM20 domain-containing protein n=2 Tax=Vitrella brassicaformis TaxID=1169539 RepID=A0A0G4GH84_VITBC|nr:unnamed protein product [Vitrella brassicaformis CCMP3155]|eukprot:CEM29100.1 unnamed protein product [Vitrella brassicaformis CCMP3155]